VFLAIIPTLFSYFFAVLHLLINTGIHVGVSNWSKELQTSGTRGGRRFPDSQQHSLGTQGGALRKRQVKFHLLSLHVARQVMMLPSVTSKKLCTTSTFKESVLKQAELREHRGYMLSLTSLPCWGRRGWYGRTSHVLFRLALTLNITVMVDNWLIPMEVDTRAALSLVSKVWK